MKDAIRIGTRGSKLALWQAFEVQRLLESGGFSTEIVVIETKGDQVLDRSLSKIGSKGLFTAELEEQLHEGGIHLAVHSAKDLPSTLPNGLEILAFMEREKASDVLLAEKPLEKLSAGSFVVGTSSTRRVAMMKAHFPNIKTVDMRGNLQTRLKKLKDGHCDALLLAYAGVKRMEYDGLIAEELSMNVFVPAVGQGSVAVEIASALDSALKTKIKTILNHSATEKAVVAERDFLRLMEGGCSVPVFAHCTLEADVLHIEGGVISLDGSKKIIERASGSESDQVGVQLAKKVLALGGKEILDQIKIDLKK